MLPDRKNMLCRLSVSMHHTERISMATLTIAAATTRTATESLEQMLSNGNCRIWTHWSIEAPLEFHSSTVPSWSLIGHRFLNKKKQQKNKCREKNLHKFLGYTYYGWLNNGWCSLDRRYWWSEIGCPSFDWKVEQF